MFELRIDIGGIEQVIKETDDIFELSSLAREVVSITGQSPKIYKNGLHIPFRSLNFSLAEGYRVHDREIISGFSEIDDMIGAVPTYITGQWPGINA